MSNDSNSPKNDPLFERLFAEAEACLDKRKTGDADTDPQPEGKEETRVQKEATLDKAAGLPLRSQSGPLAATVDSGRGLAERAKPVPRGRMPLRAQAESDDAALKLAEAKIEKLQDRLKSVKDRPKRDQQLALDKQKDKMLNQFLMVLDDLERALGVTIKGEDSNSAFESYHTGVQQVYEGGLQLLGQLGVERFESVGHVFDPNLHEAVRREPRDDMDPNLVCEVFQTGYRVDGRLLRAARVSVSASG